MIKFKIFISFFLKKYFIKFRENYIIFLYNGEKINYIKEKSFESRGERIKFILERIINANPALFINKKCLVTYDDKLFPAKFYKKYDLAFSTTININRKVKIIPIPCPYFTGWQEIGLQSSDELIKKFINNNSNYKQNKIFWIGANTNKIREKLHQLSKEFPTILDTRIMNWKSRDEYVPLYNHKNYKYLIDCPGAGYSARIKWLLASGRPLFIIDRDIIESWHQKLIPMIHYIPVKKDLSDLIKKYKLMESDPFLYKQISINAKRFAQEYLFLNKQIKITNELIQKYEG